MQTYPEASVLVVEDEAAQRELLSYNLQKEGLKVVAAGDGEEGLLLAEEEEPDLIILDWMLPHVSGIEVCRQLKMRPDTRAYQDYRRFLLETSQVAGGFYSARGRRQLMRQVVDMMLAGEDPYEALQNGTAAPRQQLRVVT